MIRQAILCTTYLTGNSLAILSVGALIMTINPVIAIFPVLGFIVSGNKEPDKFAKSGLTASKAECVDAPVINEFPICLECEFLAYQDEPYSCGVIGKIVNVTADESVLKDGKVDISLVNAIAFDPYTHGYYKVAERVGEAFQDGKKLIK